MKQLGLNANFDQKHCPKCNRVLPKAMFGKSDRYKDGLYCWCKDCCRKNAANWRAKYPDRAREATARWQRKIRIIVLNKLSNNSPKCALCGFNNKRALEVDHINGKGNIERIKLGGHWRDVYRFISEMNIEDAKLKYRILCANCNKIKHYENSNFKVYDSE